MTDELDELAERGSGSVVVAVSGSQSDRLTVPQAVAGAARLGARLLLVHVGEAAGPQELAAHDDAVLAQALARARETASELAPDLVVEAVRLSGDPVELVLALSVRARRLYLGTSETSSVRSLQASGTTAEVTNGARCPVLLVRGAWSGPAGRGGRVLAFLAAAAERDVVAFAEQEARALGLGLTILHVAGFGESWPVAADVPTTRLLEPDPARAHRTIGSPRNEVLVISAGDLDAIRVAEGTRVLRTRYAGTACLVAVVPDGQPLPSPEQMWDKGHT